MDYKKMTSKLVSFELANLLKINGFDEEVKFRIYPDGMIASSSFLKDYNQEDGLVSCPSINDAIDWIEEKYHIYFEVNYSQRNFDMSHKFSYQVIDITRDTFYGNVLVKSSIDFKDKYTAYVDAMTKFLEKHGYKYKNKEEEKPIQIPTVKEEIGIDIEKKAKKFKIIQE